MSELLPNSEYDAAHNLGHDAFWLDVYRLLSHCLASQRIAAVEKVPQDSRSLKAGYEKPEISRLLINIASYYRVKYDDGSWAHASWLHEEYEGVGTLIEDLRNADGVQRLNFREACNKIIHAKRVHFDGAVHADTGSEYLNPTIYLYGSKSKKDWKATLDTVEFCKAAMNVIV